MPQRPHQTWTPRQAPPPAPPRPPTVDAAEVGAVVLDELDAALLLLPKLEVPVDAAGDYEVAAGGLRRFILRPSRSRAGGRRKAGRSDRREYNRCPKRRALCPLLATPCGRPLVSGRHASSVSHLPPKSREAGHEADAIRKSQLRSQTMGVQRPGPHHNMRHRIAVHVALLVHLSARQGIQVLLLELEDLRGACGPGGRLGGTWQQQPRQRRAARGAAASPVRLLAGPGTFRRLTLRFLGFGGAGPTSASSSSSAGGRGGPASASSSGGTSSAARFPVSMVNGFASRRPGIAGCHPHRTRGISVFLIWGVVLCLYLWADLSGNWVEIKHAPIRALVEDAHRWRRYCAGLAPVE
jgi:hypothetical protein